MAEDVKSILNSLKLISGQLKQLKGQWILKGKLKAGEKNSPELEQRIIGLEKREYELKGMLQRAMKEQVAEKIVEFSGGVDRSVSFICL